MRVRQTPKFNLSSKTKIRNRAIFRSKYKKIKGGYALKKMAHAGFFSSGVKSIAPKII